MKDEVLQARTHDILGIRFDLTTYNAVMEKIQYLLTYRTLISIKNYALN